MKGNPVKCQEILGNHQYPWKWFFVCVTKGVALSRERQKAISLESLSMVPLPLCQCRERRLEAGAGLEAWDDPIAVNDHGLR